MYSEIELRSERRVHAQSADAFRVMQSFNTWRFKREQPSDVRLLEDRVAHCIKYKQPIEFVLYWGKGPRHVAGPNERACLEFLSQLNGTIREVYVPGGHFNLVFTDTHAQLNGHHASNIETYFDSMRALDVDLPHSFWRMSSICDDALRSGQQVEQGEPSKELLEELKKSAAKWYSRQGTAEEGAKAYYELNMLERAAIEAFFPDSIFVTFNGSQLRGLFPLNMPIFYMYSLRKGRSEKPWFLP